MGATFPSPRARDGVPSLRIILQFLLLSSFDKFAFFSPVTVTIPHPGPKQTTCKMWTVEKGYIPAGCLANFSPFVFVNIFAPDHPNRSVTCSISGLFRRQKKPLNVHSSETPLYRDGCVCFASICVCLCRSQMIEKLRQNSFPCRNGKQSATNFSLRGSLIEILGDTSTSLTRVSRPPRNETRSTCTYLFDDKMFRLLSIYAYLKRLCPSRKRLGKF